MLQGGSGNLEKMGRTNQSIDACAAEGLDQTQNSPEYTQKDLDTIKEVFDGVVKDYSDQAWCMVKLGK